MGITFFLAQIWGPMLFLVGLGVFLSRPAYVKIYRDLEKNTLSLLIFGMLATALGTMQILFHNTWETLPEVLISFLGWGLLLKGALFVVFPQFVDQAGNWWVRRDLLWLAGTITLVMGAYLTWLGYLA